MEEISVPDATSTDSLSYLTRLQCSPSDLESSLPSSVLLDEINLEDFVDIVTTYKCKFCSFSCGWKSGLYGHICNTHISGFLQSSSNAIVVASPGVQPPDEMGIPANAPPPSEQPCLHPEDQGTAFEAQPGGTSLVPADILQNAGTPQDAVMPVAAPMHEQQIFLCGQCNQGFLSFDSCKDHMIQDHSVDVKLDKPVAKAKRKARTRQKAKPAVAEDAERRPERDNREYYVQTLSKRKVRPPKALCEEYILSLKRRKYIKRHQSDGKRYRCAFKGCNQQYRCLDILEYHAKCHVAGEHGFQCPECSERADQWRFMAMHLWRVHEVDTELPLCQSCPYRTYSPYKLENHRRIHSEERSFLCVTCGRAFKQMSQLRNHQVMHLNRKTLSEKRWFMEQKCEECSRTFSDSKCLHKHMQAVHSKIKPYVCTVCGHSSSRKAMLQLHLRQHTGEKPFACDVCNYTTGDHNSLRRHKMRHTGLKPYKCPHCPYACIQAISYKTHMKNKHPGMDGLFSCALCPFRSVSKENYENHMSDHKRGAIEAKVPPPPPTSAASVIQSEQNSEEPSAVGITSGNVSAAQLIYSCLNALSKNGSAACDADGHPSPDKQTITIQIPNKQSSENEHFFFTIQQSSTVTELPAEVPASEANAVSANDVNDVLRFLDAGKMCAHGMDDLLLAQSCPSDQML